MLQFLAFISMAMLAAHLLSPLGLYFSTWMSEFNPAFFAELSPHSRYYAELFLLHLPALTVVLAFALKIHFFERAAPAHPRAYRFIVVGLALYLVFVIGRNFEGTLGNILDTHINKGLLVSRIALLVGCMQLLMNLKPAGAADQKQMGMMPGGPGGGGGGQGGGASDDEAALAALMGLMGGGGPPGGGGGKAPSKPAPPRRRRNPDRF